jgi:hypothetical protein
MIREPVLTDLFGGPDFEPALPSYVKYATPVSSMSRPPYELHKSATNGVTKVTDGIYVHCVYIIGFDHWEESELTHEPTSNHPGKDQHFVGTDELQSIH